MTTTAKTQDLLQLERRFWDAMKAKDARTASRLTDDQCIVVGAQGVSSIDRATMKQMTEDDQWHLDRYSVDDKAAQVRFINDDIALLAYKVNERLTVDGKPVTLEANDASVWVRRDGEWLCAMHTESIAGDPYGRDRRA